MGRLRTMSVPQSEVTIMKVPKHTLAILRKIAGLLGSTPGAIVERWAETHGKTELDGIMKKELKKSEKKA